MADDRKATEVLLSIERRVERLEGFMRNMDNLLKVILGRLNAAPSSVPASAPISDGANEAMRKFNERPKTNFFAQAKAQAGVIDDATKVGIEPTIGDEDELIADPLPQGQRRGMRAETTVGDKVRVTQHVMLNGQPILMGVVEVFHKHRRTTEGEPLLAGSARTSPRGRWVVGLEPGEYDVRIHRRPTDSNKNAVDVTYELSVPPVVGEDYEAPMKELG